MSRANMNSPPTVLPGVEGFRTVEQLAAELSCSVATVWRRIAARRVPVFRLLGRTVVSVAETNRLRPDPRSPRAP